jgi:hypothetical protein
MEGNPMNSLKLKAWKLFLRIGRDLVWKADEWFQRQEIALREEIAAPAAMAEAQSEVEPVASAAREKAIRRERKPRAARAQKPRLVYQGGQFVREF